MDPFKGAERRLGKRQRMQPIEVTLIGETRVAGRFGKMHTETTRTMVHLVEVSVTGAGLVGPIIDGIDVGSSVRLERDGYGSAAVIRRIDPDGESRVWYGLTFRGHDPAMQEYLFGLTAVGRPEGVRDYWNHAE